MANRTSKYVFQDRLSDGNKLAYLDLRLPLKYRGTTQAPGEYNTFGMDEPWGDGTWGKYPDKEEGGAAGRSGSLSAAAAAAAGKSSMNKVLYQMVRSDYGRGKVGIHQHYSSVRFLLMFASSRGCSTVADCQESVMEFVKYEDNSCTLVFHDDPELSTVPIT